MSEPKPHLYSLMPGHLPPDWGQFTEFAYHHDVGSREWVVSGRMQSGGWLDITRCPTPGHAEEAMLRFYRERRLYHMGLMAALEYEKRYPTVRHEG